MRKQIAKNSSHIPSVLIWRVHITSRVVFHFYISGSPFKRLSVTTLT